MKMLTINHFNKLSLALALSLLVSFIMPISADATIRTDYTGATFVQLESDTTEQASTVIYNGRTLPTTASYVWSSDAPSVLSFDSTNRNIITGSIGDARVSVSYMGETSEPFLVNVRRLTGFPGRPYPSGIQFLNLRTGVAIDGLMTAKDGKPLSGKTVTFYTAADGFGTVICNAVTDSLGNAKCNNPMLNSYSGFIYAAYEGDTTYGKAYAASSE